MIEESDVTNVVVGDYSYYSDFCDPTKFLENNVLYNFGISGTSLRIGKFCAIAHGVKFIMADSNHAMKGVSTFPFAVFGNNWAEALPLEQYPFKKYKDIVLGNEVTVMAGVSIGNGPIIGSKSVVASDIPEYSIAVGNPAKVVKSRFSPEEKEVLEQLSWWDWPIEHIEKAIPLLVKGKVNDIHEYALLNKLI